jgi:hypothetical protein
MRSKFWRRNKFRRGNQQRSTDRQKTVLNFYNIIEGMLWNRESPKQCKTTIYNAYFKLIKMHKTETWIP